MSPLSLLGTASSVLSLLSSLGSGSQSTSNTAGGSDFSASLLAAMKGSTTGGDIFSTLPTKAQGLSASGRNLSLFDPESGYRMMSEINWRDVNYKAQFAEMSAMKEGVAALRQAAASLGGVDASADAIKARLQDFVRQYNDWVGRFEGTTQAGGVLAGTQAAEVSLHELRESVANPFTGAMNGLHGLKDLGVTVDRSTGLASFDATKLDAALTKNATAAIATVQEFGAQFAKSAELLNTTGNFIPNRLDNLNRAIGYIGDNRSSLQQEFGLGNMPKMSAAVAQALAAYQKMTISA